jgi:hypothetical protein
MVRISCSFHICTDANPKDVDAIVRLKVLLPAADTESTDEHCRLLCLWVRIQHARRFALELVVMAFRRSISEEAAA